MFFKKILYDLNKFEIFSIFVSLLVALIIQVLNTNKYIGVFISFLYFSSMSFLLFYAISQRRIKQNNEKSLKLHKNYIKILEESLTEESKEKLDKKLFWNS